MLRLRLLLIGLDGTVLGAVVVAVVVAQVDHARWTLSPPVGPVILMWDLRLHLRLLLRQVLLAQQLRIRTRVWILRRKRKHVRSGGIVRLSILSRSASVVGSNARLR